ncbi:hypothetical protein MNBD_GAMMA12-2529 [hydrothermal vent metagenome]|uniref:AB hydrolase-1 domain-containing protein n=1 Tax=hydrothermal vent metagenome TaxID=652676 RepID=A0A3B0XZ06_9ZZZZ
MPNIKNNHSLVSTTDLSNQAVVLVHGIWVGSWVMGKLARRFSSVGYVTYKFGYQTVKKSPEQNAKLLAEFVQSIDQPVIHFVAHSLGGLVLLHYINLDRSLKNARPGREVFLGSPLKGSGRAPRVLKIPFGRQLLGRSLQSGLLDPDLPIPAQAESGMVCGNIGLGFGLLVGSFREPNDGTIAVRETRLDGLKDHIIKPVNHTGLLTSSAVARQALAFLQHGNFQR